MGISDRLRADLLANVPAMRLISSGGAVYFGIGQADQVAAWLVDHDVVILGIEGFACDGKAIHSLTEYIADFSDIEGVRSERLAVSRRASEKILSQWTAEVEFVDFITDEG